MDIKRVVASGLITVSGLGFLVPTAVRLTAPNESLLGIVLAGLGAVIASVLVVAGVVLYRSDISTPNTVRVAAWDTLGIVVLGLVLVLSQWYLETVVPAFLIANILAVSAFAHFLIGFNDVRRIRAEEVADKNEKLAVLSRLLRHNLRTEAQSIIGYTDLLAARTDDPETTEYATKLQARAEKLGSMNDNVNDVFQLLETPVVDEQPVALDTLLDGVVDDVRSRYPDAEYTLDVPSGASVLAGEHLATAVTHLVENAVLHNDQQTPRVEISATAATDGADWFDLTVRDNGPGIPEIERTVVSGETEISQLAHSQGLGLWVVRWIATVYDGALQFGENASGGHATLKLRSA